MTNAEMVLRAALTENIYTEEQCKNLIIANGGSLPLYTFKEWKARGYVVKKGQHSILTLPLWSYVTNSKKAEDAPSDADGEDGQEKGRFRLRKMHLFDFRQVEKMTDKKTA